MASTRTEEIISKIQDRLGISIDRFSYDYDIIDTLSSCYDGTDEIINQFMDTYNFENLKSNNLDNFLNFFDIHRRSGTNDDLYTVKLKYSSNSGNVMNILKNCTVKYDNEFYKVLKDSIISNDENFITMQKIFNVTPIDEPVFSNDGILTFDKNFIKSSEPNIVIESEFSKKITAISITRNPTEKESDFEFLEKAKSILQSYGYSNEKKIELTLLKDNRIKSVYITSDDGTTNITIFPNNIEEIDKIIKYNQNVVDYYKASNIILHKPNLFEINIRNIEVQLANYGNTDTIKEIILEDLKSTLSSLYSDDDKIKITKDDIISTIKNSVSNYSKNYNIDYNNVNIFYNYYYKNNYKNPIYTDIIYDFKTIRKTDIITLGNIE